MQSNCKQTWFDVGRFWNFTLFLTNSAHSIEWFLRGEFNLQSSHNGHLQCWHLDPFAVPSTGVQHSKQTVGVFGFGPTTNGISSRTIDPATTAFSATAYRPTSSLCLIRSKFVKFVDIVLFWLFKLQNRWIYSFKIHWIDFYQIYDWVKLLVEYNLMLRRTRFFIYSFIAARIFSSICRSVGIFATRAFYFWILREHVSIFVNKRLIAAVGKCATNVSVYS